MKRKCKRLLPLLLAALLLQVPAWAMDGGMPPPPPGDGGGGAGAAGQEFATFDEIKGTAAIYIGSDNPDISSYSSLGEVMADHLSGALLERPAGYNGIAIQMDSETDVFTIGGPERTIDVDGELYNTVIRVAAGEGNNDAGYEAVYGVAAAINTGELRIENSCLYSDGPRSTPVYAFSTQSPSATSLVVLDSKLEAHSDSVWMPPFKLLAGGARATLLMTRNNSWFYGSQVLSNNWGAISQDSVDATTYVVNSSGISTEGGYGTYLTYGMRLYGSELYAGQYGVFMCGTSDILTDTGEAALSDEAAMSKVPDYPVDTGRVSTVAAPFNAVVIHNSLPDITMVAKGVFRNSVLSTLPEDLPERVTPMAYDDEFFLPGVDIVGSGNGCGAAYFFNRNLYGSLALVRSMNADLTFDHTDTRTSNGVLVQSVITYDPPSASGYLTPEQDPTVPGISATFLDGAYTGDILHQDYQRSMTVTVGENATLTGKAVSGTYAAWNGLWSEEQLVSALQADGHAPEDFGNDLWVEDVQANLIRPEDTVYQDTENLGIALTVAQGGSWVVNGDSSLKALTLEEGASITAPAGCTLTFYTGCDTSNALDFYDETGAEALDTLAPGTYENVVIRLSGTPIPEVEEPAEVPESAAEASEPEPTPEPTPEPSAAPEEAPAVSETPAPASSATSPVLIVVIVLVVLAAVVAAVVLVRRKKK